MTQAIGYIRRSTDRQEESLEQQRAKLEAFADARGWRLVAVYSDDAISGSDMHRPGLERLLTDGCKLPDIDVVLAWDRNRLARPKDPIDGMLLERKLCQSGKRVMYAASGQEVGGSFASGLISYVEHHQNGDYLRKLSRDTIRGIAHRAQRGLWPGGPIPFGYDRLILSQEHEPLRIVRDTTDGSQVILDPATGDVMERLPKGRRHHKQDHELCTLTPSEPTRVRAIQRMFSDFAAGKPTRQLRDGINAAGFRTSRGSMFTVQTILPILENPAYLGRCVYNRRTLSKWHRYLNGTSVERPDEGVEKRDASDWIVAENAWPALVEADVWEVVKKRREAAKKDHRRTTSRAIRGNYLLTGVAFCSVCGGRLAGMTTTSAKGYRTRYYICCVHNAGHKDRCPKRYTVPADFVEQYVIDLILTDLDRLRDDESLRRYVAAELRRACGGHVDACAQLQRRLADLDQQTAKLQEHILALDPATAKMLGLYDRAKAVAEERQEVEAELAKLGAQLPNLPDASALCARASAAFDDLRAVLAKGTLEEKRELIGQYVQKIEAEPDTQCVRISLYPALFNEKIAGAGFEPATSRL